jgi:hypothetical protein
MKKRVVTLAVAVCAVCGAAFAQQGAGEVNVREGYKGIGIYKPAEVLEL